MEKLSKIFSTIAFLGLASVFVGFIFIIWFGIIGVKIMGTGATVFLFFALLYSVSVGKKGE